MQTEKFRERRQQVLVHAKATADNYLPEFLPWLEENAHIYIEFEHRAINVARFRKHYSARTIVEVMRHDSVIGELSGEWKINDHSTPDMARLFVSMNPQYQNLFEFRREKAEAA